MTLTDPSATMTPTANRGIHIRNLDKSYRDLPVLQGLDLELVPDRIYGLLGPNGAGKTTLLSVICNHTFRTGGAILIDGQDPAENAAVLARTCFVHEDQSYNDVFTVEAILRVLPAFYPGWDEDLCRHLVSRFRLPTERKARKLSRGQKSALAVIISLSSRAPYTFLDEPYLGLDPTARQILHEELLTDFAAHPRTIVLSTHLIDEAVDVLNEVVVLHHGTVVLRTDVEQARRSAFVARGLPDPVLTVAAGREIVSERTLGRILSATVRGQLTDTELRHAAGIGVAVEPASLQELIAALGIYDVTTALSQEKS
jgi:ABC-2 type transport system ATP-binding protein